MSRPRIVVKPFLAAGAALLILVPAFAAEPAKPPATKPPEAKPPAAPAKPTHATHVLRNIGGPGDYGLRERLIKRLMRDPEIAAASPQIAMVNGGAVLSGEMPTWAVRRRALVTASTERGIVNVTDQMSVTRGDVKDAVILKGIADVLKDRVTELEIKNLEVTVEDGVATLRGGVKDFAARVRAEETAGTVLGATRVVNRLRPATVPSGGKDDTGLRRSVVEYLKNYREYGYLGNIEVQVKDAKVILTGALPLFIGRQQAGTMAALVDGVKGVDNRIEIDPGLQPDVMVVKEIP